MIRTFLQARAQLWPSADPALLDSRPAIVSVGVQAQIVVFSSGDVRNERALFGRRIDGGARAGALSTESYKSAVSGGQAALWETQRCLVPMTGFMVGEPGKRETTWICGARSPLFAAGLRSVVETEQGFHLSCFSLLVDEQDTRSDLPHLAPLFVRGEDVVDWFYMEGGLALKNLIAHPWPEFLQAPDPRTSRRLSLH